METVMITGGTGMIGKALTEALIERGYRVIVLTRRPQDKLTEKKENLQYADWDVEKQFLDKEAIKQADHIIHLAGASLAAKRWTKKWKREIVNSRVNSSRLIAETLQSVPNKIKTVICASAIGWYGDDAEKETAETGFVETDPPADNFLGHTCRQWEAAIEPVSYSGKRLVKFRIGLVLSKDGGALPEFLKPLRFGLAPVIGSGKQIISWIHIDDLIRLFLFALENEAMDGSYNAVAPQPVSNKDFILMLGNKIRGRFFIPVYVPAFVLQLLVGEMSIEILKSASVSAEKILNTGFIFQYADFESSLQQLCS